VTLVCDAQDMALFIVQQVDGERVLYSQEMQARYDHLTHLHALFLSCHSSSIDKHASSKITSKALAVCLESLHIVPAQLKLEQLYKVCSAAKVPIQVVTRGEGSGYSGRRKVNPTPYTLHPTPTPYTLHPTPRWAMP